MLHFRHRAVVFFHDFLMIPIAWLGAFWLRFNLDIPPYYFSKALVTMPIIVSVQLAIYWSLGLYRGVWRFASIPDLVRIAKAVFIAILLTIPALFLFHHLLNIPRSIFPLYGLLAVLTLGGSRIIYRWYKDYGEIFIQRGTRVLIVGAGQSGELIVRELLRDVEKNYHPVAFVDDRLSKQGQEIHGVRVVGRCDQIPSIVKHHRIELIIIAMTSGNSAQMRRLVGLCEQTHLPFRTLPSLTDIANGSLKIDSLREVSLEDLLGREPLSLDWSNLHKNLEDKVVLITGGGGSIGSELCRQIAKIRPKKIVVLDNSEFNLYSLNLELSEKFPHIEFISHLADITDRAAVQYMMKRYSFDIIFHAAAYKHVPMLESQCRMAVRNNILGTQIVATAAVEAKVEKFVLISTDKAVNPTNTMGATKRVAEMLCQYYNNQAHTQFITIRFGNVLGSAGSVVPLFRKQIEQGGPVTVTHPDITRFFMTIPEASQLILQTTVMGKGGEIFVLDMGEPIKIRYLAEQMILLSGLRPHEDIEIKYTGLRPGEKLYEELFHENEELINTRHSKIMQARFSHINFQKLLQLCKALEIACENYHEEDILRLLNELVPEYKKDKQVKGARIFSLCS